MQSKMEVFSGTAATPVLSMIYVRRMDSKMEVFSGTAATHVFSINLREEDAIQDGSVQWDCGHACTLNDLREEDAIQDGSVQWDCRHACTLN